MNSNPDHQTNMSETQASQGIKLGSVRYVLAISLFLTTVAGVIIWNLFAA